ncbi:MAG: guanine deaminase [Saccharothrix sp.]|nr:guanine deaminase [Saccharothrix sp.]
MRAGRSSPGSGSGWVGRGQNPIVCIRGGSSALRGADDPPTPGTATARVGLDLVRCPDQPVRRLRCRDRSPSGRPAHGLRHPGTASHWTVWFDRRHGWIRSAAPPDRNDRCDDGGVDENDQIPVGTESCPKKVVVFYGVVLHFLEDPWIDVEGEDNPDSYQLYRPGALVVADGRVEWVGPRRELPARYASADRVDHGDSLITPGFVDTHIHLAQVDAIASPGHQLLPWLKHSMYPAEMKFADLDYARRACWFFCDTLLSAGTTTASVYTATYKHSTDALFAEAARRGMRLVTGKLLMDDNFQASVPPGYLDKCPEKAIEESRELIERWHGHDRLRFSVSPRFALTSTAKALGLAGDLYREHADSEHPLWVQSHIAESRDEVDAALRKFKDLGPRSYLDIYDRFRLVGPRSVWGHAVWLDGADHDLLATTGAAAAFCPTSNLFLGSGLFPLSPCSRAGVRIGLGTDVGGGTSYSLLATLNEAYKVVALSNAYPDRIPDERRMTLTALRSFYLATLGGARALHLDRDIGSFARGREADFVVLDWAATPVLARRTQVADSFEERLFALATLGDDRAVSHTYLLGALAHERDRESR